MADDDKVVELSDSRGDQIQADQQFLLDELRKSAAAAADIPDLAGFALIAWDGEAKPYTLVNLGATVNPTVPRQLIPAYVQIVMQQWHALCCEQERLDGSEL